jgi:hypothetical protein
MNIYTPKLKRIDITSAAYTVLSGEISVVAEIYGGGGGGGGGSTSYGGGGGGSGYKLMYNLAVNYGDVLSIRVDTSPGNGAGGANASGAGLPGAKGSNTFLQKNGVDVISATGGNGGTAQAGGTGLFHGQNPVAVGTLGAGGAGGSGTNSVPANGGVSGANGQGASSLSGGGGGAGNAGTNGGSGAPGAIFIWVVEPQ